MKTRMFGLTAAFATLATSTAVFAGNADVAVVEPAPAAPVVVEPVAPVGNWTGAYGGLSFGGLQAETDDEEESAATYGVFGGYDYQFQNGLIMGAEVEYSGNDDLSVGDVDIDNLARFKVRGGYDLGNTMLYATAGVSQIDTNFGSESTAVGGIGAEYRVTEQFGIGAEYLYESFDDVGDSSIDLENNSLSLRGTYRF
ncbi:outer membrane protein [Sagittula sp. SSi028]|uniref:outer membrane protein n=1 Tax=Sagittula sp. SSi028 TaxID=3400636 RepID=UPI003AF5041E